MGFSLSFFIDYQINPKTSCNHQNLPRKYTLARFNRNTRSFQQRLVCTGFPPHEKPLFWGAGLLHSRLRVFVPDTQEDQEPQQLHAPLTGSAENTKFFNLFSLFLYNSLNVWCTWPKCLKKKVQIHDRFKNPRVFLVQIGTIFFL